MDVIAKRIQYIRSPVKCDGQVRLSDAARAH